MFKNSPGLDSWQAKVMLLRALMAALCGRCLFY